MSYELKKTHQETTQDGLDVGITLVSIGNNPLEETKVFETGFREETRWTYGTPKANGVLPLKTKIHRIYNPRNDLVQEVVWNKEGDTTITTVYEDTYTEQVVKTPTKIIRKVTRGNTIPEVSVVARQGTQQGPCHTR